MASSTDGGREAEESARIQDAKFFAAIGYLSVLCFVPLLLKKDNSFAMFHGKQALVLFILEVAAGILKVVPALGDLVFTVSFVVFGILSLIGITKVLMGERWEMPVIYEISNRITF
jgi:fumarate reductase subunit D